MSESQARILATAALVAILACATPVAAGLTPCVGDCDGDRMVSVNEIVTMVSIALGTRDLAECKSADGDGNGKVEVDDLIRAVDNALNGCRDIEPPPFKTGIDHPFDSFLAFSGTPDGPSWVKFTIRLGQPSVVYFQNSAQIRFHHDFVSTSLEPYIGWTPAEIDAVSLHAEGQELVFGAVLYSPSIPREIAIQLVRQDAYSVDEVIAYFEAVRASVRAAPEVPFFYFPTFEQQEAADGYRAVLEEAGIPLGSTARWLRGDACYAFGWAHGRVVFVAGDEIDDAYESGTLRPQDILLTDGVPAEIPFVAGVLSLAPSTPNSHVAILAADWGIPFAFLAREASVETAQALVGRDVILRATTLSPRVFTGSNIDTELCQIRFADVTGALSDEVVAHLRDLKQAPDLQIRPFVLSGTYSAEVATATPDDIVTIGGKAANYGFLMRATPSNTRPAMAFTFDLWNDYLDQPIDGGATLRERIATLLAPFPTYPPADFAALYDALDDARDLIDDVADFTPAQRAAIVAALTSFGFDPMHRIRFRSSTNVEDSDVFTGAGLYESESGCLADDTDGDEEGPSHCDASRSSERGVFRALRKVFQSFYSDNAFLERLRHRVDESQVGMAVLVNKTFADETELANGVALLQVTSSTNAVATIVSQPGPFSVTNPEEGGVPEVVEVRVFRSGSFANLRQEAERLPLGATVLQLPGEYTEFTGLLLAVANAFGEFHGETQFDVEFEFKKITGEGLVVKQVRRIPGLAAAAPDPVLIDTPAELCTFQGERADVFANYRLKTRWRVALESGPVGDGATIFAAGDHDYVAGGEILTLTGPPSAWPQASHESFEPENDGLRGLRDSWRLGERKMTLTTLVPESIGPNRLPIVFIDDLGFTLGAEHDVAVPYLDFEGKPRLRAEDEVALVPCPDIQPVTELHLLQSRGIVRGGIDLNTGFYWPPSPTGAVAGYTAPLDRWTETTITGIGTTAARLQGYFSQTYRPEHHNFTEGFIFDPHLEEGIAQEVLEAWDAAGIRALVAPPGFDQPPFMVLTAEGQLTELSSLGGVSGATATPTPTPTTTREISLTPTPTPSSNRPPLYARAEINPPSAISGEIVTLDGGLSSKGKSFSGYWWRQSSGTPEVLSTSFVPGAEQMQIVAPDVETETLLEFELMVRGLGNGCCGPITEHTSRPVGLTVLPAAKQPLSP